MFRACRAACLLAILLPLSTPPSPAAPDGRDPLVGRWDGAILVRPAELEVGLSLAFARSQGNLTGRIAFPTQGPVVHDLAQVDAQGSIAQWIYKDPNGDPSVFSGALSADGLELAGTVQDGGKTLRFALRRVEREPVPPTVTRLSADGAELRSRFERDQGDVRLLMILSPTCTYCRSNARIVESYLLDRLEDPHLKVYVVWEHVNPGDTESGSREVAGLMADRRAAHFWSDHRFTGNAFREAVGNGPAPPWDILLAFAPRERWAGRAPSPEFYMVTQKGASPLAPNPFNGLKLAAKVGELLRTRSMP